MENSFNTEFKDLQRFLDGAGGTIQLETDWLRSFSAVINAEEVNQSRFESQLYDKALALGSGERDTLNDY